MPAASHIASLQRAADGALAPTPGAAGGFAWVVPCTLILLIALLVLQRMHTYSEPFERDLTSYAVYAHELLKGRKLYTEVWDHKPPGQFVTYVVAELIVGYGPAEMFFLNVVLGSAALLGAYAAGKTVAGRAGGLGAAAIWTAAAGSLWLEGNQPNTELGINTFMLWGVALLWSDRGTGRWLWGTILSGVMFAVASLYKHPVAIVPILLGVAMLIDPPAWQYRRALKRVLLIGVVGTVIWASVFAYFKLTGREEIFYNSLFRENETYAGDLGYNLAQGAFWQNFAPWPATRALYPPAIACIVAFLVRIHSSSWSKGKAQFNPLRDWKELNAWKHRPISVHALAWALGSWLAVTLPGRYYPHYYQLWLPAACVGGGWAMVVLARFTLGLSRLACRMPVRCWTECSVAAVPALAVLGSILAIEIPTYALSAQRWSELKYGPIFVIEKQSSAYVNQLLEPGESLYNFGNEMGFYFYPRRDPPVGMISSYLLHGYPMSAHFNLQILEQLQTHRPELVVVTQDQLREWTPSNIVYQWLSAYYRVIPGPYNNRFFVFGCLKGGKLEQRLGLHPATSASARESADPSQDSPQSP